MVCTSSDVDVLILCVSDDSFYDTIDQTTPEYDNAVNQTNNEGPEVDPEERAREAEEWQQELAKVSIVTIVNV